MTALEFLKSVQYMVDEDGKRTAAVVQIELWQRLMSLLRASDLIALKEMAYGKTPEQVIAEVQARPVNTDSVIPPKGSLLDIAESNLQR